MRKEHLCVAFLTGTALLHLCPAAISITLFRWLHHQLWLLIRSSYIARLSPISVGSSAVGRQTTRLVCINHQTVSSFPSPYRFKVRPTSSRLSSCGLNRRPFIHLSNSTLIYRPVSLPGTVPALRHGPSPSTVMMQMSRVVRFHPPDRR